MDSKERYIRATRYVTGECSEYEKKVFEQEMEKSLELKDEVTQLQAIWNAKKKEGVAWNVDMAWKRFDNEVNRRERQTAGKPEIRRLTQARQSRRGKTLNWILRIAAVFILAVFATLFLLTYGGENTMDAELAMNEVTTESGQRIQIHLQDGTKIHLNSESRVVYPKVFDNETRYVQLTGEAYFDVESDDRPFHVYTEELTVEILGTEFNVKAYAEEEPEVVVASGKVGVRVSSSTEQEPAILTRGEMARLNADGGDGLAVFHDVDLASRLGWLNYRLFFDNQPMSSVSRQLERWYGVEIQFDEPMIKDLPVTANFENDSIHEVLRVITLALDLNHEITGSKITLFRN